MYRVEIESNQDLPLKVKSKDYEFLIDIKGRGVTPPDTLLASLGSCIGVYIRKYAEGAKLAIDKFVISVEAEFSVDKPARFKNIKVSVDLKGADIDERRKNALLEFIKNCPVHNTLKNNPLVDVKVI